MVLHQITILLIISRFVLVVLLMMRFLSFHEHRVNCVRNCEHGQATHKAFVVIITTIGIATTGSAQTNQNNHSKGRTIKAQTLGVTTTIITMATIATITIPTLLLNWLHLLGVCMLVLFIVIQLFHHLIFSMPLFLLLILHL